ncbi:hypothetical protein D3C76_583440 [compost metagenome]
MAATGLFLSPSISKLELYCGDASLGTATGFFYKKDDFWFMVTNWHVLSGRYPKNGQPRHHSTAVPDRCRFTYYELAGESLETKSVTYFLYHPEDGSPRWFQHPDHGQEVDVAVFQIDPQHLGQAKNIAGEQDSSMFMDLGQEVFIPGFPLGLSGDGLFAIWKRASIASSLEFGEGQNKKFLVDTASREGMSGSPCLAIANWKYYSMNPATGKVVVVDKPLSWRLLGVYSGRLNPSDSLEAQIGVIWRENLIEELLNNPAPGSYELKSSI